MSDLNVLGVAETVRRIAQGELTSSAVVEAAIAAIGELDGSLNAISVVLAVEARAEAAERDRVFAAGDLGHLHGLPVVIKEENDVAGTVTTFGGAGNSTRAVADCEVVRRLRAAGAVVVAKTNMPEFGAFPYTESVARGITRNPWNPAHTPGGSSGGTAAAVASGMAPAGIGGDGGGSIRIPSAFCGVFGLKPQRGRVTTAPNQHLWLALGVIGPIARSVLDSAMLFDVIRGNTGTDLYRAGGSPDFVDAAGRNPGRLRIGWSAKPASPGVKPDPINVEALDGTARLLAGLGHDVFEIDPRYPDSTTAFVPQFLGGIRAEADAVEHYDRLEARTRELCRMGVWVHPRVIDWALRRTEAVALQANRIFDRCDVLLTPVTANRPPRAGILDGTGAVRALLRSVPAAAYTAIWNVAGNPAASVPCGIGADGLPTAVQIVAPTDGEAVLFSLAAQLEQVRPWPLLAGG